MASSITVAMKFSNRAYERYYDVTADLEFNALKDEIKSLGAKFVGDTFAGYRNTWHLPKGNTGADALKALKAKYQVVCSDVRPTLPSASDIALAGQFVLGHDNRKLSWEEWNNAYPQLRRDLQDAYNNSDEAFVKAAIAAGAFVRGGVIADMLGYHRTEEWAKQIISANQ